MTSYSPKKILIASFLPNYLFSRLLDGTFFTNFCESLAVKVLPDLGRVSQYVNITVIQLSLN